MNVKNSLKVSCVGLAGGIVLRVISVLVQYDADTGFYRDGGLWAWICVGFVAVMALLSALMCLRDKKTFFAPYSGQRNRVLGVSSLVLGVVLLITAYIQGQSYFTKTHAGEYSVNEPLTSWIHLAFVIACVLFGLLQLALTPVFFRGLGAFEYAPALYLVGVLWGIVNLLFMFVYYSYATLHQENFYVIVSSCLLLLSFYDMSRYFAGIGKEHSARLFYAFGFPAVLVTAVYTISNALLRLLFGMEQTLTQVPPMIQLLHLAAALYLFVSLVTVRKYDLQEPAGPRRMKKRRYAPAGRRTGKTGPESSARRMKTE